MRWTEEKHQASRAGGVGEHCVCVCVCVHECVSVFFACLFLYVVCVYFSFLLSGLELSVGKVYDSLDPGELR